MGRIEQSGPHRIEHPIPGVETRWYGDQLDEVVAENARLHLEEMNDGQWWLGIYVGKHRVVVNLGVVNTQAKTYANAEADA